MLDEQRRGVDARLTKRVGDGADESAARKRRPRQSVDGERLAVFDVLFHEREGRVAHVGRVARSDLFDREAALFVHLHGGVHAALCALGGPDVGAGLDGRLRGRGDEPRLRKGGLRGGLHRGARDRSARNAVDVGGLRFENALFHGRADVAPVARSFVRDVHLHGRDASVRNGDPDRNRAHALGFARKTAVRGRSVSRGKRHRRAEHGETERLPHIDAFLLASLRNLRHNVFLSIAFHVLVSDDPSDAACRKTAT